MVSHKSCNSMCAHGIVVSMNCRYIGSILRLQQVDGSLPHMCMDSVT